MKRKGPGKTAPSVNIEGENFYDQPTEAKGKLVCRREVEKRKRAEVASREWKPHACLHHAYTQERKFPETPCYRNHSRKLT